MISSSTPFLEKAPSRLKYGGSAAARALDQKAHGYLGGRVVVMACAPSLHGQGHLQFDSGEGGEQRVEEVLVELEVRGLGN